MSADIIPFPHRPRPRPITTPLEDLEWAMKKAWDRQAERMFCAADQRPYSSGDGLKWTEKPEEPA